MFEAAAGYMGSVEDVPEVDREDETDNVTLTRGCTYSAGWNAWWQRKEWRIYG